MSTAGFMNTAVLCTPLRVEHAALRGAGRSMRLVRTGMGPQRAAATAATLTTTDPVLVAGVAAAQTPDVHPGDVVVATEVHASALAGSVEIPSAALLAGGLRRLGLRVHLGAISSVSRIAWAACGDGAIAVDMESAQLVSQDRPCAVVRAIVDTSDHPLWRVGTLRRGVAALRTLRACRPVLEWWAAATGPREVLTAAPCTSERAVRTIAGQVDLMLVAGSSDPARLVEVARRQGVPAYLVGEVSEIDLRWLVGATRLGVTAASPHLLQQIVYCLGGLGPVTETRLIEDVIGEVS